MKLNKLKLTASLSLVFGVILAGGFLLAQAPVPFPSQPSNPVYAPPQAGQGGFQIPGRAKMAVLTAPANNTTGLIADPTGACAAQNYANFWWNPFTRNLIACMPTPGLTSGSSLANAMTYGTIINGGGLAAGFGATLTGATIVPTNKAHFFNGSTALVTITPPTGITSNSEVKLVFSGTSAGLTWTAAGNISVAGTSTTALSSVTFTWDVTSAKWIPSRLA